MFAGSAHSAIPHAGSPSDKKIWRVPGAVAEASAKPVTWLSFWELKKAEVRQRLLPAYSYSFDDPANPGFDRHGQNNLTVVGATSVPGISGNALQFSRDNGDYAIMQTPGSLANDSGVYSVSFWVNIEEFSTGLMTTIASGTQAADTGFLWLYMAGGQNRLYFQAGTEDGYPRFGTSINNFMTGQWGEWLHIVVIIDHISNIVEVYRNGGLFEELFPPDPLRPPDSISYIIGSYNTSSYNIEGDMDEVRFYRGRLTPEQIQSLYENPGQQSVIWGVVWLLSKGQTLAEGKPVLFEASGTADWDLPKGVISAQGKEIRWTAFWELAKTAAEASGKSISWLTFWQLAKTAAEAQGKTVDWDATGTVDWELSKAIIQAVGKELDLDYVPLSRIPDLNVKRTASGVEVDLLNSANANLSIRRGTGNIAVVSEQANIPLSELPWLDVSTDAEENYIYMVAFTISGEKDGQPVEVAGETSSPRITIGKNRSL